MIRSELGSAAFSKLGLNPTGILGRVTRSGGDFNEIPASATVAMISAAMEQVAPASSTTTSRRLRNRGAKCHLVRG